VEYARNSHKAVTVLGDRNSQSLGKCQRRGATFTPERSETAVPAHCGPASKQPVKDISSA